jgi:predicted phosphodiesterase
MRVAALADIHGNLAALEAVLAEIDRTDVDLITCNGDVAAGPQPSETLALFRSLGERVKIVRGNADREVGVGFNAEMKADEEAQSPVRWVAEQLEPSDRDYLAALPEHLRSRTDAVLSRIAANGHGDTDGGDA